VASYSAGRDIPAKLIGFAAAGDAIRKESPERAALVTIYEECLVLLTRRLDTIPKHKSGKARIA
jgi:hypothetical protein